MKIEMHDVTIRELVDGYRDDGDDGVFGYGGRLDIRPPYQREFVYDEKDRVAVIDSIMNGFPLNVMYWVVRDDGGYEVMDGQQRTTRTRANCGATSATSSPGPRRSSSIRATA